MIEKVVGLAEKLTPTALIGVGGIGKTSVALAVLHHDRIKQRFGEGCRFLRCDQFPASRAHFLNQLSTVIGAGAQNSEDLTPLRPFLSLKEIFIVLDNAESILDPQGVDAQEIYALVEELSRLETVCLCITSRISTIPPDCETLDVPILSMESGCDAFYHIYKYSEPSDIIKEILVQLGLHPLSITLLATVAHHNKWDMTRLIREWEIQRTNILYTQHKKSLAATIELSLTSPMFQDLGPDARELLGVVAFFPQGINESNIDWLFPTIPNGMKIFDGFCILSLTYRSNGFITMLAPLQDYLCPKDPKSSPLLCIIKDCYFSRLSVGLYPGKPGFREAQWVILEDANIEHLLNVFTVIDADSVDVWDTCSYFMNHLCWHKPRLVILGTKVERLPDHHPSKTRCLTELSGLSYYAGRFIECKRFLTLALDICQKWGDGSGVTLILVYLSEANRVLGLYKEGVEQAKAALEICEQSSNIFRKGHALGFLAWLLYGDNQLTAAEEVTSQAIGFSLSQGDQFLVCQCYRLLGLIHYSKDETEKAIDHLKTALGIASTFNWASEQFGNLHILAAVFLSKGRFDDAHIHIEHAKSHTINDMYNLGRAMELQAECWYRQYMPKEARFDALCAAQIFEKLGAIGELEACRNLLYDIGEMEELATSGKLDFNGKLLKIILLLDINYPT